MVRALDRPVDQVIAKEELSYRNCVHGQLASVCDADGLELQGAFNPQNGVSYKEHVSRLWLTMQCRRDIRPSSRVGLPTDT